MILNERLAQNGRARFSVAVLPGLDYCRVRFSGTLREILPAVAVTRTVPELGCIAGGGGFDEPLQAARNKDIRRPAAMIERTGFVAAAKFFRRSSGNGNKISARTGKEVHNRVGCR